MQALGLSHHDMERAESLQQGGWDCDASRPTEHSWNLKPEDAWWLTGTNSRLLALARRWDPSPSLQDHPPQDDPCSPAAVLLDLQVTLPRRARPLLIHWLSRSQLSLETS